jgi:hypothetical protein
MTRIRFRLVSPAILSLVFFPPLGIGGLLYLIAGFVYQHLGKKEAAEHSFVISNKMIEMSVYGFLILITIASFIVFWMGGSLISVIGSFY